MRDFVFMEIFIYGLVDPKTISIRYVGKTVNIKNRYKFHIKYDNKDTYKLRWIKNLKSVGLLPSIILLDIATPKDWEKKERYWISFLKEMGEPLTNGTEGGDGRTKGFKHSQSACEKIRQAVKNRPKELREIVAKKVSLKLKGRPLSENNKIGLKNAHLNYWNNISEDERRKRIKHLRRDWSIESREKLSATISGSKHSICTSIYKGVSWFKRDGCWRAWIYVNKKQIHLGYYFNEEEAAKAYNEAVIKYNKPLTFLNIIPNE